MDLSKRFEIHQQLGEGSFSKIYQAYDRKLKLHVALKVEKEDKHKKILKFEYEILKHLQGLPHVPKLYDFVQNVNRVITFNEVGGQNGGNGGNGVNAGNGVNDGNPNNKSSEGLNFIVMELLGKNVGNYKKSKSNWEPINAYEVLLQMIDAIEQLHDRGYIHRDIKPTNFVVRDWGSQPQINVNNNQTVNSPNSTYCTSTSKLKKNNTVQVYMVDYGLAKVHLDRYTRPLPPRTNTDFRGTLTYASLNAHYKKELSRRDDLWSFFFVILDLLNENLPWRTCKDDKDDIKKVKEICLADPEKKLLLSTTKNKKEILDILNHIKSLNYGDRPNYFLIKSKLNELRLQELNKYTNRFTGVNPTLSNLSNLGNLNNLGNLSNFQQINHNNLNNSLNNLNNLSNLPLLNKNNPINTQNLLNELNLNHLGNLNFNSLIHPLNNNQNINNSNCILYDFPPKNEECESPTKGNFFINNFLINNAPGVNPNNLNESNNFQRTNSNLTNTANYCNYPENGVPGSPMNNLNSLNNQNSNLLPPSNFNSNLLPTNDNNNSNNFSNNLNTVQAQLLNQLNSMTSPMNNSLNFSNLAQCLYNSNNYFELTKKLYFENFMNMNLTGGNFFPNPNSGNLKNFYENCLGNNLNQNNFYLNSNLNSMDCNFTNLNNFMNDINNLNSLKFQNLFNQNQNTTTPSNNQMFSNYMEEKFRDEFKLINKKRKREDGMNLDTLNFETPQNKQTSTQQQNQIFIINQFNKSQLTELEQKLLEYLLKQNQTNQTENLKINQNHPPQKFLKEKDNDKMLINSIIQKLKPTSDKKHHTFTNMMQSNSQTQQLTNINNLINKIQSAELNQLLENALLKNNDKTNNLILDQINNWLESQNVKNIDKNSRSKIFKIEKSKK